MNPPYFSWIIESDEQNLMQKSYHTTVMDDSNTVWDSGVIESDQSTFVSYAGESLTSRTIYQWTVTITDNQGNTASATAGFETALLEEGDWSAQWAESDMPHGKYKEGFGNQPPATLFRKGFLLSQEVKSARLYATCHGVYRLTLNGQRPDDREFAPEHTVYDKFLCYQTYDVSNLLQKGENALGMYVGDGWYCGPKTIPNIENFTPIHAVLFQLEVTYADGSSERIISDSNVKTTYGLVLFSDMFGGEKYDANQEIDDWDSPSFDDDAWKPTKPAGYGHNHLHAQAGAIVRPVMELPVSKLYTSPKGETIIDFGQNLAGRVKMKLNLPKGAEIQLDHFETTDQEGNYFNNIMFEVGGVGGGCEQRIVYVSNGKPSVYEPLFTFQGFRFVKITCAIDVKDADFTAVVLSTEKEDLSTFECSNQLLNRLYENTRWSQRSNMVSVPTDCPQREKAGWTGDVTIYAKTSLLNEDTTPFLSRWLKNMTLDQGENGAVPIVAPYEKHYVGLAAELGPVLGSVGLVGSAGWGDAAVQVPWAMYEVTGNTAVLRNQYDCMKRWCDYIIPTAKRDRGANELPEEIDQCLWNTGFHFGDWLIPSLTKDGYNMEQLIGAMTATLKFTAPVFGWLSISRMAEISCILGNEQDQKYYGEIADKMKQAIAVGVIDKDGNPPTELMGAYALLLNFDLVPEQFKTSFGDRLVKMIADNDGCLDTGFLGTPFLLDALCKIGHEDEAYKLLYQEKCPSWLHEVTHGATSIWESWYSYKEDGTPLPMSLNHYAFGCVDDWMFRYIGGMDMSKPGFKHIVIHPRPDASLTYAKRSFMSEFGLVESSWEKVDGKFVLNVTIPCNTTATVIMPSGVKHEIGSGR